MREKELRIALVCFGGISLAIYMHGISKEILKLVRASSKLHAIADRARRAKASYFDFADRDDPEYDTEDVYFELLREIGRKVELQRGARDRLVGRCPFHVEHTPSLVVDDNAGEYHCLGCGVHGDAVDFVLRTEPLLFRALLEWLGRLGGRQ